MIDLDRVKDYRVLFIGDAIIDEYMYVKTIGKAVKENALSSQFIRKESFAGGVVAAHKHLATFCKKVSYDVGTNIMWNRRVIDDVYLRKLFVIHDLRDFHEKRPEFDIGSFDLVVITDFGHGCMTDALIEKISKEAKFLAVNAQTNATNYGFNMITKYPRADFVVVDELEARLATHDAKRPIEDVILKLGFKKIIVTQGTRGAIGYDGTSFERQDALTDKVVDTMGAGDAFLAVTSPFAAAGFPMKDLLAIGNAAGAIKCAIIGHRTSVTKEAVSRYLNEDFTKRTKENS